MDPTAPASPFLSVVIPTYGRPKQLLRCLESLAQEDCPRDSFEVIVVVDGHGEPPPDLISALAARLDVRVLSRPHAGPAASRNAGAALARGTLLVFIDDDCVPAADWLSQIAARFAEAPTCAIGGRTLNGLENNPCAVASQMLVEYFCVHAGTAREGSCFFAANNLALPAESFREIGGFDADYRFAAGEDRDLCERWAKKGHRMVAAPEAVVHHEHALSLGAFCRQQFNYGRGAFLFRRARRGLRLEALSFYLGLLAYPSSRARGVQAVALTMLFLVSQCAVVAGFLWEGLTNYGRSHRKN